MRISWRTSPRKRLAYAVAAVAALAVGVTALSAWLGFGIGPRPTPAAEPSVDLGVFAPVASRSSTATNMASGVDPAPPTDPRQGSS